MANIDFSSFLEEHQISIQTMRQLGMAAIKD